MGGGTGTGGGSATGGGGGSTSGNTGGFPDITNGSDGRQPTLIVDAAGTRHLLYEQLLPSNTTLVPYRYGECSSNCALSSNWQFTSIGDRATFGALGKLSLNAQGKPRIIWARSNSTATVDDPYVFHFASCDSGCTTAAGWTSGPILNLPAGRYIYEDTGRNFSVDGTGRAHLVFSTDGVAGLNYMSCAANCTQAASWSAPIRLSDFRARVSLATTATGQVKLAFTTQETQVLSYRTCESGCDTLANWSTEAALQNSNKGQVSMRLDEQGRPRIFFNQNGVGTPSGNSTYYGWCESNCTDATQWQFADIGLPASDGKGGLDFDLHTNGEVSAAMETDKGELSVVRCMANCQSLGATWLRNVVETGAIIAAQVSPLLPNCSAYNPPKQPYAFWFPGEQTSASVNPVTHMLEVAHRTYTLESCGIAGNQTEGVTIARYSGPF